MSKLYLIKLTAPNPPTAGYTVYYNTVNPSNIAKIGTTTDPATNLTKAQLIGEGLKVTVPDSATSVILYSPECVSSTTFAVPPSVAVSLSPSEVTSTGLVLSWTATPGGVAVAFLVFQNGILIATLGVTSNYIVSGLTLDTNYNFSVQAKASQNRIAGVSNSVNVTTPASSGDTTPPSTPINFSVYQLDANNVRLNWSPSTDNVEVAGYEIHVSTESDSAGFNLVDSTLVASYVSSVTPFQYFYYKVRAYDSSYNLSPFSLVVEIYPFT